MRQAAKVELHQISIDAARAVLHEQNLGQLVENAARRLVGERFAEPAVAAAALEPLLPDVREVAQRTARDTANATTGAMVDGVRADLELARADVVSLARDATERADAALAQARGEVTELAREATEKAAAANERTREYLAELETDASAKAEAAVDAARREVVDLAATATETAQRALAEARAQVQALADETTTTAEDALTQTRALAREATTTAQAAVGDARAEVTTLAAEATARAEAAVKDARDEVTALAEQATSMAQAAVTDARTEVTTLAAEATARAEAAVKDARTEVTTLAAEATTRAEVAVRQARDEVRALAEEAATTARAALDAARTEVVALAREAAEKAAAEYVPRPVEVHLPDGTRTRVTGHTHEVLPELLLALGARCHVLLVGPAGTGKSMLATHAAQAMDLRLHGLSLGPTTPMSKVFGYYDAHGNYHDTPFRRAFEHGGVMLLDELDNGHPGLLAELNQALALGVCAFADGMVPAHPDFRLVATANTYGTGGDRQYVGRQALDAATLDRFVTIDVPVDETLEERVAMALAPENTEMVSELLTEVRRLREVAGDKQLPVMFSPRVSYDGARLFAAGATFEQVLSWRVVRGLSAAHRTALGLDS